MKTRKMKTSINLKTRKMKNKYLKLAMMAAVMLSASIGFAQTTTGNITKQDGIINGTTNTGGTVKVIDNKGTIKYLQSNNGITTFTNTDPGSGGVVTTWQLGGTLATATDIDLDGNVFSLDQVTEIDFTAGGAANQAAITTSLTSGATGITGYTFIVRDEATGGLKKMKASDLITGIRLEDVQAADATANVTINVTGLPVIVAGTNDFKLSVYRNGVKLRYATDFNAGTADLLTITYDAVNLPMYTGDIIEIVYLK